MPDRIEPYSTFKAGLRLDPEVLKSWLEGTGDPLLAQERIMRACLAWIKGRKGRLTEEQLREIVWSAMTETYVEAREKQVSVEDSLLNLQRALNRLRAREDRFRQFLKSLESAPEAQSENSPEDEALAKDFWKSVVKLIDRHMTTAILSLSERDKDIIVQVYGLTEVGDPSRSRSYPSFPSKDAAKKAVARARRRLNQKLEALLTAGLGSSAQEADIARAALHALRKNPLQVHAAALSSPNSRHEQVLANALTSPYSGYEPLHGPHSHSAREDPRPGGSKDRIPGTRSLPPSRPRPNWKGALGPMLDQGEVRDLIRAESSQTVSDLTNLGLLLALDGGGGRKLFPAFQFDPGGQPFPEIAQVLKIFSGAADSPYTIASWLVSPNPLLDQRTPAEWMRAGGDPEPLFEAARRSAAPLRW